MRFDIPRGKYVWIPKDLIVEINPIGPNLNWVPPLSNWFCLVGVPVATYPSAGTRKGQNGSDETFVSEGENEQSLHQRLFKENVRKTEKTMVKGLRILKMRVRESFTHAPITRDDSL